MRLLIASLTVVLLVVGYAAISLLTPSDPHQRPAPQVVAEKPRPLPTSKRYNVPEGAQNREAEIMIEWINDEIERRARPQTPGKPQYTESSDE